MRERTALAQISNHLSGQDYKPLRIQIVLKAKPRFASTGPPQVPPDAPRRPPAPFCADSHALYCKFGFHVYA